MIDRFIRSVCLYTPLLALASAAGLAILHAADLFRADSASGVWLGLAYYVNHGVLYPPLEADGCYGGARYMPLSFCLHALLAKGTGEYLVSGHFLNALSVLLLLSGVFAAVLQTTRSRLLAISFASLPLAMNSGLLALLNVRGDALAAALSVWGLVLTRRTTPGALSNLPAAVLFAAALMTKFTAVAGFGAAALLLTGWRRRLAFVLQVAVVTLIALAAVQYLSDGRFFANLSNTGSGGIGWGDVVLALPRLLILMIMDPAACLLSCAALLALIRNVRKGDVRAWDWYFFLSFLVLIAVNCSPGIYINHLVEIEAAGLVVLSRAWADLRSESPAEESPLARWLPRIIFLVLVAGAVRHGWTWLASWRDAGRNPEAVVEALPPGAAVLSDDATAPVVAGRRPVVLDPFAFRVLAERGVIDARPLAARVSNREFAVIILSERIDVPDSFLYPKLFFGAEVTEAIRGAYRFERRVGDYYFFVPGAVQQADPGR
jgi:hypothetical protein